MTWEELDRKLTAAGVPNYTAPRRALIQQMRMKYRAFCDFDPPRFWQAIADELDGPNMPFTALPRAMAATG